MTIKPKPIQTPTPTPSPTLTTTPKAKPTLTPTPIPRDILEAYRIVTKYIEENCPNVLEEGVLTSAFHSVETKRFVFEWSHEYRIVKAETDRALFWISEDGRILKKEIQWEPFGEYLRSIDIEDCRKMERKVKEIENVSVNIIGYWRIKKVLYISHSGEPLKDWYWMERSGRSRYLVDEDGHIVGQNIPPP